MCDFVLLMPIQLELNWWIFSDLHTLFYSLHSSRPVATRWGVGMRKLKKSVASRDWAARGGGGGRQRWCPGSKTHCSIQTCASKTPVLHHPDFTHSLSLSLTRGIFFLLYAHLPYATQKRDLLRQMLRQWRTYFLSRTQTSTSSSSVAVSCERRMAARAPVGDVVCVVF